ncbi:F-box/LRR-repeat protein [Hordeum vulgare]|nr:F-box/LRR-repeat protein [Hordeum vulgare]
MTFLALAELLGHLTDKGVEDLTLVNRPFSFDVPVQHPVTLLRYGVSLRRLYLGVRLFRFTTDLPRGPDVFPNLQELGLCHDITEERDLEYVLACSPKLETLALISNYGYPDRVRVGSRSLRCMLLWHSLADEVAVVSAPSLQRLIIYYTHTSEADGVIKVKIGHAPQLVVLGYLDTATHQLEIGNTIIKAGVTNVCPNTVLPSVKVLALKVRFRVPKEVRTLLCFLICFPGVETLHIMASNNDTDHYDDPGEVKPGDKLNFTFGRGSVRSNA